MREPLGRQQLTFTSIFGEDDDTPPMWTMEFRRKTKGGVIIGCKYSLIVFRDDLQRAWRFPQGPRRLQIIPSIGQPLEEVTPSACPRKLVTDGVQTVKNVDAEP